MTREPNLFAHIARIRGTRVQPEVPELSKKTHSLGLAWYTFLGLVQLLQYPVYSNNWGLLKIVINRKFHLFIISLPTTQVWEEKIIRRG